MRLTIKGTGLIDCEGTIKSLGKEKYRENYNKKLVLAHAKLGQLEDIEEELGIDFILMTKAKSVFVKDAINDIYEMVEFGWDFLNKRVIGLAGSPTRLVYACFKDYGKTWALTKEELL